jgi:hypothetical protein
MLKMTALWVKVQCSLIEVDRCLRGAYCLHHHGDDLMMEAVCILSSSLLGLGKSPVQAFSVVVSLSIFFLV